MSVGHNDEFVLLILQDTFMQLASVAAQNK